MINIEKGIISEALFSSFEFFADMGLLIDRKDRPTRRSRRRDGRRR
jgi:hypothetical protein